MNFRDLMNTLDNINKPMLAEALTLSAIVALTAGYEQDDKVRIPKLADLAKQNGLEGLVDPVTGHYVSVDGDEEDEVPFEIGQKLAQAGLLPKNARLEQAGWFDNNDVWNKANAGLIDQSSTISSRHDEIGALMQQVREIVKNLIALRDKHAASKMGSTIGEKPVLPSNAPSAAAANITPTFPSQTAAGLKESAGLADALMESFGYADESHPLSSASAFYAQNMGLYEKAEWTPKAASWSQPATTQGIQDTSWLGKSSSSPTWTAPSNSSTSTPKASAMDMGKLAGSASKGIGKEVAAKAAAKSAGKFVPGLGAAIGLADMGARYNQGDYTGAGIAGLSTVASQIPGLGWGASAGLDLYNLYRDQQAEAEKEKSVSKTTKPAEPVADTPAVTKPAEPVAATAPKPAEPVADTLAVTKPTEPVSTTATPASPKPTAPTSLSAKTNKGTAAKTKHAPSPSSAPFDLRSFQSHLNSLGATIAVDGRPGPATDAAVRTYLLHQK